MHKQENSNCELYRDMLYDYASDNLSEQDRADFLMHINSCPDCKRELDELNAILGAASEIEEVEVPDSVRTAVSAALTAESVKIRNRKKLFKFTASTVLPIAACAALAIGIYSGGIHDDINKADHMITDAPVQTPPSSDDSEDSEDLVINDIQSEESTEASSAAESPQASPESERSSDRNRPSSAKSNTDKSKALPSPKPSQAEPSEPVQSSTTEAAPAENSVESAEAPSVEQAPQSDIDASSSASEKISPPKGSPAAGSASSGSVSGGASAGGGGSAAGSRTKSARPAKESALEESIPAPTSSYSISEDTVEESSAACYDEEFGDAHDKDDKPTAQGCCTITVDNPTEFAKGFGINKSGSTITFTVSASQWREFINYCRSYGVSLNASFPESEYSSITVTVTQGR